MEDFIRQLHTNARGIWKYRWPAIAVMWLSAAAGWTTVACLPDDYQTSARVWVDTQGILKPLLSGMTSIPNVEQQVAIMSRTLLSKPNIERVMRMVDMDLSQATPREHEVRLEELMNRIRIAGTGSYDIYTITYNDTNPRLVRDVVQSLLAIFVEGSFKGKKNESQKAVQFIEEQINSYETKLQVAENTVKEFKVRHTAQLPRAGEDYSAQLAQSSDALNNARLELLETEQLRAALRAGMPGTQPLAANGPITDAASRRPPGGAYANDASLNGEHVNGAPLNGAIPDGDAAHAGIGPAIEDPELDARITAVYKTLDTLRLQYTELHPDIVAARRLVAQLEQRKSQAPPDLLADPGKRYSPMMQQLKVALTEANGKVAAIRARTRELGVRHARLQAQSKAIPELESQLSQLNRDYQVNKENYEKLISKREAAKLSGDLSSTTEMMSFRIIDPPTLPARPASPNRPLLNSAVLAAALTLGCATALLANRARPTFGSAAELRAVTGLQVVGTIAMYWTPAQLARRRRGKAGLGAAVVSLLLSYAGVMAHGVPHL